MEITNLMSQSLHNRYLYKIITLYCLHLYSVVYQIHLKKQAKKKKVLTFMNAPEMVLQGKSWRKQGATAPEINSRYATFVRRTILKVCSGPECSRSCDQRLWPTWKPCNAQTEAGTARQGPFHHLEDRSLAHAQPLPHAGLGLRTATGIGLSTVFSSLHLAGPGVKGCRLALPWALEEAAGKIGMCLKWVVCARPLQTSLRGHPDIFSPQTFNFEVYFCLLI